MGDVLDGPVVHGFVRSNMQRCIVTVNKRLCLFPTLLYLHHSSQFEDVHGIRRSIDMS